jgi:hypothetical protein
MSIYPLANQKHWEPIEHRPIGQIRLPKGPRGGTRFNDHRKTPYEAGQPLRKWGQVALDTAVGRDIPGAARPIRTRLYKGRMAVPYVAPSWRHSARAAARFFLKMDRLERLRSALK